MANSNAAAAAFRALAKSRRSIRRFQPNKIIPDEILTDILKTTNTAPSGFNLQPTQVIMVTCEDVKKELAQHAMLGPGNAFRVVDASAVAVFCADMKPSSGRIQRIVELEKEANMRDVNYMAMLPVASSFLTEGGSNNFIVKAVADALSANVQPMPTMESIESWSVKNSSLMTQMYVMAAQSHGLGTCIMEGFDARRAQQILRIPPDRYTLPLMVATGYDFFNENENAVTPRLPLDQIFFGNTFGAPLSCLDNENTQNSKNDSSPSSTDDGPNNDHYRNEKDDKQNRSTSKQIK